MRTTGKISKITVIFAAVLAAIWALIDTPSKVEAAITLRVTNSQAISHCVSIVLEKWCKDLERRTNGRVTVRYYPAATLAPAVQQYDAVTKGIADVGNHVLGYTMGRFPFSEVLDLPLGVPSGSVATRMANEFYKKFRPNELENVKVLWFHAGGPGYFCTKGKAIRKLEDMKALKLRTHGGNAKFVAALGATPVAMPMGDVYDALSRGVVDGLASQYETLESRRTGELLSFVTENKRSAYTAAFVVAMNKKVWNSLPSDIKNIIDQMSDEYVEECGKAWDKADESGKVFVTKKNAKIISLSNQEEQRWVDRAAKPLFFEYTKRMKEKGLPGDAALKFVLDYLKPYQK